MCLFAVHFFLFISDIEIVVLKQLNPSRLIKILLNNLSTIILDNRSNSRRQE